MAILTRPGRAPRPQTVDDTRMSVIEHLEALRRALIISIGTWLVATVIAFIFSARLFHLLLERAGLPNAIVLSPTGGVFIDLKVAIYVGLLAAAPVIFWQAWWFVSPGLHAHERRLVLPLIIATTFFFLVGVGFALFSLPLFLRVLKAFTPPGVTFLPESNALLGFVLAISIAFGIVFELPVVMWTLGMLRIVSSRWLYRHRLYFVLGLGLLANVMTPGVDPITPLIVFVPLYVFWEGTTLLLKLAGR